MDVVVDSAAGPAASMVVASVVLLVSEAKVVIGHSEVVRLVLALLGQS